MGCGTLFVTSFMSAQNALARALEPHDPGEEPRRPTCRMLGTDRVIARRTIWKPWPTDSAMGSGPTVLGPRLQAAATRVPSCGASSSG